MSQDPGLRFWLRYAEREGALIEEAGDSVLLVLPRPLRERFDLPEEVSVTADSGLAREEGALLLIPGHPLLDAAAAHMLEEGDVGLVWLAWPAKPPPARTALLAAARDQVGVEHGRIDADAEAVPRYTPVLRVGAQVSYLLNEHFHEREEVWVDACTALPLDAELERRLRALPRLEDKPGHARLEPDLSLAVQAAHALLEERARVRFRSLARQSEAALRDELALADAYYAAVLDSIAERQKVAPGERQALFDAQAQATRVERKRRQHEIEEKFQARHQIRPIRLHLVLVPTLLLHVVIQRGERSYPFELTWWLPTARFADVRCPACRAPASLVAGKDRVGCQACLSRPAPAPSRPESRSGDAAPSPPAPESRAPAAAPRQVEPRPEAAADARPAPAAARPLPERIAAADRPQELHEYEELRRRVIRVGKQVGRRLLASHAQPGLVAAQARRPALAAQGALPVVRRRRASARAGDAGRRPPQPEQLLHRGARTQLPALHLRQGICRRARLCVYAPLASGSGQASGRRGASLPGSLHGRFPLRWSLLSPSLNALYEEAPAPRIELDPVASVLWDTELAESGLPLVVRCLAAWWRIAEAPELSAQPAPVLAAALTALVGRRAGLNRTQKTTAADYGADPAEVSDVARRLQRLLRLAENRSW